MSRTSAAADAVTPFGRWLEGDPNDTVLFTMDRDFSRSEIRSRIRSAMSAVGHRAGLVAIIGYDDADTVCASIGAQLAGCLTTVLDLRVPGLIERVAETIPVDLVICCDGVELPTQWSQLPKLRMHELFDATVIEKLMRADDPSGFAPGSGDCVVLFSSGSTGQPKGIVHRHESMPRDWFAIERRSLPDGDNCLVIAASLGYVTSQENLHQAWRSGMAVGLFDVGRFGLVELVGFMQRIRMTMFVTQVATYRALLSLPGFELVPLRCVSLWGERLYHTDLQRHQSIHPRADVSIGYGSTESMVGGCVPVVAGEPFPERLDRFTVPENVMIEVRDPSGDLVDAGQVGELFVANPWLADRYLGQQDLTDTTFVARDGHRWCRTGDRARLLPDNTFELLGRIDNRLKVLGHNVEPTAIEEVLRSHDGVADAVVVALDRPGGGIRLAAFIVAQGTMKPDAAELRALVQRRLTPASVPTTWISLADIPRSRTGKIDRSWLLSQASQARFETHPEVAPRTPTEKLIHFHCCEVLGVSELGIDDDLVGLGLDSIMIAELQIRIGDATGVTPTLTAMVQSPTVRALSSTAPENPPLVHFRSTGEQPGEPIRFVLLPGAGGHELSMRPLADHLARHGSVRAVAVREYTSVRSLVSDSIASLKKEPVTDLVLIGHSLGGQFAVEIANEALANGFKVALVVLLDSFAPQRVGVLERMRIRISPRYRLEVLRQRRRSPNTNAAHRRRREFHSTMTEQFLRQVAASSSHDWNKADVAGLLLRSSGGTSAAPDGTAEKWSPWFLRGLTEFTVAGEHSNMIEEPYASEVAHRILEHLRALEIPADPVGLTR